MIPYSTISSHYVSVILKNLGKQSAVNAALLNCQIPLEIQKNKQIRISLDKFIKLVKHVQEITNDEGLGYYLKPQKIGTLDVLMPYLATANTLESALNNLKMFYKILDLGIHLDSEKNSQFYKLRLNVDPRITRLEKNWVYEEVFTKTHRILSWLTNERGIVHQVNMPYAMPNHIEEYALLFGSPVKFDAINAEMLFANEQLSLPICRSKKDIDKNLGKFRYILLKMSIDPKSYTEKVRTAIKNNLPEHCTYEDVAKQLAIHQQTLRRRLHDEGTNFKKIKNEIIRDLAFDYLSSNELSIKQVSFLLNFSAPSSFNRAFKQWSGISPAAYQKAMNNES